MTAKPSKDAETTHESAVDDWARNAQAHEEANFRFLRSLKQRDDQAKVDALAAELHESAFRIIDCTRCANCCKTMSVVVTDEDIERIAGHLGMTAELVIEQFLVRRKDGQWQTAATPCPFLGDDDRCTIYEVRPECCAGYPHTDREDFWARTYAHASNTLRCPAVF